MKDTSLPIDVQILNNLKGGDVVWVHVAPTCVGNDAFLEALREAVITEVAEDVAVFITPTDLVDRVSVMSLVDLFTLRNSLDLLIEGKLEMTDHVEE